MKRRRFILIGVAAAAAGIALLDALYGGAPAAAEAAGSPVGGATAAVTARAQQLDPLLDRLRGPRPVAEPPVLPARNVFAISDLMRSRLDPPPPPEAAEAAPTSRPADPWRLRGVISGRRPLALLNEQIVGVGAVIAGHRVVEIRRGTVVLSDEGGNFHEVLVRPE